MRLDIYVNYPGCCEEAFHFYERHLSARLTGKSLSEVMPLGGLLPLGGVAAFLTLGRAAPEPPTMHSSPPVMVAPPHSPPRGKKQGNPPKRP